MTNSDTILKAISLLNEQDRQDLIKQLLGNYKKNNPLEFIQTIICHHLALSPNSLKSKTRKQEIVFARQLIMYFARKYTNYSLSKIGEFIGGKDHATVLHAYNKIEKLSKKKEERELLRLLTEKLNLQYAI